MVILKPIASQLYFADLSKIHCRYDLVDFITDIDSAKSISFRASPKRKVLDVSGTPHLALPEFQFISTSHIRIILYALVICYGTVNYTQDIITRLPNITSLLSLIKLFSLLLR